MAGWSPMAKRATDPKQPASNAAAATQTIEDMRAAGALGDVEPATVTGFLLVAQAVDAHPENAALWREYRSYTQALKEAAAGGGDDESREFSVTVRAPVVDPKKP